MACFFQADSKIWGHVLEEGFIRQGFFNERRGYRDQKDSRSTSASLT